MSRIRASDRDLDSSLVYFLFKDNNSTHSTEKFEAFDENQQPVSLDLVKVKCCNILSRFIFDVLFYLKKYFLKDWFEIDKNGTIFTKSLLDREIAEYVTLVIAVEDINASNEFKPQIKTSKFIEKKTK